MSLLLTVDATAPSLLWKQITDRVAALVDTGALEPGDRLPATRRLARQLGVNRSTVCRAYEELWALGYLQSTPGSYSTIRSRPRTRAVARAVRTTNWEKAAGPGARRACAPFLDEVDAPSSPAPAGAIDFSNLTPDVDLCPVAELRRSLRQVMLDDARGLLDYGDLLGYRPLRETLARRMRIHGIEAEADEVLLTQGAQQALDLVLRLVCRPGATVVVEEPTYSLILPLIRFYGMRPLAIPMTPDGMDLDVLERRLRQRRPVLLYTMPNFQNPTGITTSQAHRERLLAICERHGLPILEDGFEEDMKYFGRAVLPIKSMDARGLVIYVGTFSKVIAPGLRAGWVAADRECIRRLALLNRFGSLSGMTMAQAAMDRFSRAGRYDAYLRRLHATCRRRMSAMLKGLTEHAPVGSLAWSAPAGGCTIWVEMIGRRPRDERRLVEQAQAAGVLVSPGSPSFAKPPDAAYLRLSIARARLHQIDEGCRRLARTIARL
jgi:DNA-binding transcriptional MocR family regulator